MDNVNQYYEKILKSSKTFLKKWKGSHAQLWEMTSSHRTLKIVLGQQDLHKKNLVLSCLEPTRISGPVEWDNCNIEVTILVLSATEIQFRLIDTRSNFEVLCLAIEIKENLDLQ